MRWRMGPALGEEPPSSSWGGEGAGCAVRVCEGDGLEASVAVNFLYGVPDGLEVCSPSADSSRARELGRTGCGHCCDLLCDSVPSLKEW